MKKFTNLLVFFILVCQVSVNAQEHSSTILSFLEAQPEISSVKRLPTDRFQEKYSLMVQNEIDWVEKKAGKYNERVILCYKGFDRPTLIVTEGYFAHYGLNPGYEEELSRMFDTNIILCEYRYFGESVPENPDWQYLTVDNSLADLHHIRQIFGRIMTGKWISTGISKGGQTTMFYRATYPEDVDISVSYVAPLNKDVEDGRHEVFLAKKVGSKEERKAIRNAQKEILLRKKVLLPLFVDYAKTNGFNYHAGYSEIYDYCVFELPFALWQWGTPVSTIPSKNASDKDWFSFFIKVSEGDYFSAPSAFTPFFVQAARELGYYGYSTKGLKKYLEVKNTKNYIRRLMLPEDAKHIKFDKGLYKRTVRYLKENDPKHIFIYGEIDPWSASGVAQWLNCKKKENMRVYVQPKGSHKARIGNMPTEMRDEIVDKLTEWLK